MQAIDIMGLKNFRIFDDKNGILEEIAPINILTGTNNARKAQLSKFFQILKDSMVEKKYPFDLDLTQQNYLLGDFDNLLFNKDNREITL